MESVKKLLDLAKAKTGSDYKTAQHLGVGRAAVSNWRGERSAPNANDAWKLAELLDANPAIVIATCEAARAKDGERQAWIERVVKLGGRACVAGAIGVLAIVGAGPGAAGGGTATDAVYYVKLTQRFRMRLKQIRLRLQRGQTRRVKQVLAA